MAASKNGRRLQASGRLRRGLATCLQLMVAVPDVPEYGLKRSLPYRDDLAGCVRIWAANWIWTTYLNEMPYWATLSKPFFHTSVTSQALVACRRHDRNAEVPLPPTVD